MSSDADSDLRQCIEEQRACADYLNGEGIDKRGAWAGLCDNIMEEALIRLEYMDFLRSKVTRFEPCGFAVNDSDIHPMLFDFQRAIVRWAVRRGRAAVWADCGLGKTFIQVEWARLVAEHTGRPVLIFAPLAVSKQTVAEGQKIGVPITICESNGELTTASITNYEKLHRFTPDGISGIVLDESSILKGFDGETRKLITEFARKIPYRLACSATPAPNDYMELGNHAEFLGVMTLAEMLAMFFVHDGGDTSKWRLKRHAEDEFWKWVCSWAVALRSPADLGFDASRFVLPPLRLHQITVDTDHNPFGTLFPCEAKTLDERRAARKSSLPERVKACADLIHAHGGQWAVWCNLNDESESLAASIEMAVEVTGSDLDNHKESAALGFAAGEIDRIVSKPRIFGYGMNWQCCHQVAFVGLSDSYEQFYQAIRRCWRFGQIHPVDCYIITSAAEGAVVRNIERKERQARELMDGMAKHMHDEMQREVTGATHSIAPYSVGRESSDDWTAIHGDCVEKVSAMESESVHYSIFSPPFASLYTYSNSERDMGNAKDYDEFARHFDFLVPQLFRVLKSGRLISFHCMNLPLTKERDGVIGIRDFRGELIRIFERAGFVFHSEVCIWKDPVTAMHRTKAIGLLYKQLRKDSALSRQGIPDYLVTMRKPGFNAEPITKTYDGFPVSLWQRYASPVWMDIDASDTLSRREARDEEDERHICPLQLQVIERAIELWTNPGDLVLSPFMGIGSEGYVAVRAGRKFIGVELKESYWQQSVKNLRFAEQSAGAQGDLFGEANNADD